MVVGGVRRGDALLRVHGDICFCGQGRFYAFCDRGSLAIFGSLLVLQTLGNFKRKIEFVEIMVGRGKLGHIIFNVV